MTKTAGILTWLRAFAHTVFVNIGKIVTIKKKNNRYTLEGTWLISKVILLNLSLISYLSNILYEEMRRDISASATYGATKVVSRKSFCDCLLLASFIFFFIQHCIYLTEPLPANVNCRAWMSDIFLKMSSTSLSLQENQLAMFVAKYKVQSLKRKIIILENSTLPLWFWQLPNK